ncbi:MAG: hypothetical protein QNJ50_09265 [Mastigocoleus sp. MO_188.B34]|nr:hypothetical protein [Mastigocoleus sp. MO_188.B34]
MRPFSQENHTLAIERITIDQAKQAQTILANSINNPQTQIISDSNTFKLKKMPVDTLAPFGELQTSEAKGRNVEVLVLFV